jgi:putative SOS response-associated peptidase YedK
VVPFNSFSEFNKAEGGDIWFALDETRSLACFAGIWTNWTSVRIEIFRPFGTPTATSTAARIGSASHKMAR